MAANMIVSSSTEHYEPYDGNSRGASQWEQDVKVKTGMRGAAMFLDRERCVSPTRDDYALPHKVLSFADTRKLREATQKHQNLKEIANSILISMIKKGSLLDSATSRSLSICDPFKL